MGDVDSSVRRTTGDAGDTGDGDGDDETLDRCRLLVHGRSAVLPSV